MKKIASLCICFAAFAAAAFAVIYDESNFSSYGRLFQYPSGDHWVGKDDAEGRGMHHPGEECGGCHREGGRAETHLFTMAGTLYRDRSATAPLKGGEIIMQDREGHLISMTSNSAGNFWCLDTVASDPYTVGTYHGHEPFTPLYVEDGQGDLIQPADPADSRTWKYKTWVRKGDQLRPMVSIAGVGGGTATTNRMGCNMHHGGVAHRAGGLWVGSDPTLPDYPRSDLSYRKHIFPILRSHCAPCHIPGRTMTSMNTKTDHGTPSTAVDYSGGLDLMTYGGSSVETPLYHSTKPNVVIGYEAVVKRGVPSVVDLGDPDESLILRKTVSDGEPHGGGAFWNERHPDYRALRQWIAEGAVEN